MDLVPGVVQINDEMIAWRHDFHRHPEICFREVRTAAKIAELLQSFGVDEVFEGVGGTGVVGILKNDHGPGIGLRADMDALALADRGQHDHRSTVEGMTHACGHDGHISMLLGAAKHLSAARKFKGTVVFVFQPAEEITSGAHRMMEHGFLERYDVQSIYAMHSFPGLAIGHMGITPGPVMAAVDNFTINVNGRSGHASAPHLARDPIVAAAAMVSGLQTVVSRTANPIDPVVVSITSVQSSSNLHNVIPETVQLLGTVRYLNPASHDVLSIEIKSIVDGVAAAHGVVVSIEYEMKCSPVVNPLRECELAARVARNLLGDTSVVQLPPMMAGEDFACFLQRIPGAFILIGNGADSAPLHNSAYDFNDQVLPIGASYFVRMVEAVLA